jgi:predicted nucleic acid-binding Zn ribbon protein
MNDTSLDDYISAKPTDLRYTASVGGWSVDPNATNPVVTEQVPPADDQHTLCALCGTPIDAGMFGTRRYCSGRCKTRAARGQPAMPAPPKVRRYSVPFTHPGWSVEPCPKCGFPESDGGACEDCGWTLPRPGTPGGWTLHPAGTVHGSSSRSGGTSRHPMTGAA